ncbi:Chromatin structure remodeling complex protein sfh1 [Tulasnella sp. JGI-2019a]|nr:Chromatin structure remodeling complex protein sfh1 [Tulasnella sp. JGI-2019a]
MSGDSFQKTIEDLRATAALHHLPASGSSTPITTGSFVGQTRAVASTMQSPRPSLATPTPRKSVVKPSTPTTPTANAQPGYHQPPYYNSGGYYNQAATSTGIPTTSSSIPAVAAVPAVPAPTLPTFHQARTTTYASRMRTGATLLMQPVVSTSAFTNPTLNPNAVGSSTRGASGRATRAVVNYADPGSGDDLDAKVDEDEDDSGDEDFTGSRIARRDKPMMNAARAAANAAGASGSGEAENQQQSYLGRQPPNKLISSRVAQPAKHQYYLLESLEKAAKKPELLIPIRVEVETDSHRIRDCFTWNLNEELISPLAFAQTFCQDLELPNSHVDTIVNMIRAQLDEHSGIVTMDVGGDQNDPKREDPDCRVILRLDVQLDNYHLVDHIEWDLCSSPSDDPRTTPEAFAKQLCADLGLRGESVAIIAHALHEEILKHKKDAVEWGVLVGGSSGGGASVEDGGYRRNQRGPRRLKGVWRDWMEFRDYGPRMEVLTNEELERREVERERASRRMRRETSKFQRTGGAYYRDSRPARPSRLR